MDITEISKAHRLAFHRFLKERGIKYTTWCKLAGVPPSTLRSFLNADGAQSISIANLSALARHINVNVAEIIGEETKINSQTLIRVTDILQKEKERVQIKNLTIEKEGTLIAILYDTAILKRNDANLDATLAEKAHSILQFEKAQ